MPRPSFITLFLAIAVAQVLVATVPAANALQGVGVPPHLANRAEHVNVNRRMVKQRRAAADDNTPVNPAAGVDDPSTSTTTPPASSSTPAAGGNGNGNANTRTTTTTQSTSQNIGLLGSVSQLLNGSSTSSTVSSTSTTSTSSTPPPTSTAQSTSQSSTSTVHSTTRGGTVVYITASVTDSSTAPDNSQNQNTSFLPKPVIIGLIVAGSCVVAAAAIWTVIRKWKFSPSRHFEDRLEPINWEPTQASGVDHDPTMAALGRSTSRTGTSRPDSFHSGEGNGSVRNMSTAHNDSVTMAPDFPPPHDFTAGPSTGLNAGYVDMHRGPSPAPTQYGGAYGGQYEAPNPYDAYDYNAGYSQQQRRY